MKNALKNYFKSHESVLLEKIVETQSEARIAAWEQEHLNSCFSQLVDSYTELSAADTPLKVKDAINKVKAKKNQLDDVVYIFPHLQFPTYVAPVDSERTDLQETFELKRAG
jgi:hypothetical protein